MRFQVGNMKGMSPVWNRRKENLILILFGELLLGGTLMKMFKRIGFMMALALVLAVSVGCAKKQPGTVGEGYGEGDGLTPEMRQAYSVIQDQKIYFDFDRFDIRSEYQNVLREKADVLKRYPQINVLIEGHCDERGTEEYNMALGERRARAAYEYLLKLGVSPNQLQMISYGKDRPAVMGSDESAWSQNRRDEFKVLR